MPSTIQVKPLDPYAPDARSLIKELDEYQLALYPAESNHLDSLEELNKDHVLLVGAYRGKQLLGCGAVKIMPEDYGEIKRVYVPVQNRGNGIARKIMTNLENYLVNRHIFIARLETGIYQPEALALYERFGYKRIGPFGDYQDDPFSVFMEKKLLVTTD